MADHITAAIRTAVASLVGLAITWLATKGLTLPEGWDVLIEGSIFAIVTGGYNIAVNWLQARYGRSWGFLLLIPKLPSYSVPEVRVAYGSNEHTETGGASVMYLPNPAEREDV